MMEPFKVSASADQANVHNADETMRKADDMIPEVLAPMSDLRTEYAKAPPPQSLWPECKAAGPPSDTPLAQSSARWPGGWFCGATRSAGKRRPRQAALTGSPRDSDHIDMRDRSHRTFSQLAGLTARPRQELA